MRTACLRAIIMGLFLAGFGSVLPRAAAQQYLNLVNFNANWRYNESGTDLGTEWRTNSYNDSAWPQGPGLLQGGEGTAYPQPFGTTMSAPGGKITYYFRHTFTFTGTTNGATLYATNFIDDGAVIYLNGREAARIRMPAGTINFNTLASGGPATEGQVDLATLPAGLLRPGQQNLIAVEVHQPDTTSSDVVWGTRLVLVQPTSLAITNQPDSTNVLVGDSVTFSVGVSGGPVSYQWFKNGAPINGQTASTLTLNTVTLDSAGSYTVRVSNTVNVVTSDAAVLTVLQDTQGPEMISARVQDVAATNQISLEFDETLTLATVTTNNLRVVVSGTSGATASYVVVSNITLIGRRASLRVGGPNWSLNGSYYILANNVADSRGNLIAPNSVIPVSFPIRTNVIQMSAFWNYHSAIFDPGASNLISGNQWYRTNFVIDPLYWGTDHGIFWFDQAQTAALCAGDTLSENNISFQEMPTLFRTTFNIGTNFGTSSLISGVLSLRFMVDDGMILYLNGVPIYTNNLPAGTLSASTKAINAIDTPSCSGPVTIEVSNLMPRTNWLAAAVCQAANHGADTYFGVELDAIFYRNGTVPADGPTNAVRLTAAKATPNTVRISWPNTAPNVYYGWNLQSKSSLASNALWMTVSNQSNGLVIPASQAAQYYRLCKGPNSGN